MKISSLYDWDNYEEMMVLDSLRWLNQQDLRVKCKLRYFGFDRKWSHSRKLSKFESKELCQLITSITTYSSIKSICLNGFQMNKQESQFLRMWFCEPFGYCSISQVDINENELQRKEGKIRQVQGKAQLNKKSWILVSKFSNN